MVKNWARKGLALWVTVTVEIPLVAGDYDYTIGPSGSDVTADRPLKDSSTAASSEIPMVTISRCGNSLAPTIISAVPRDKRESRSISTTILAETTAPSIC